MSDGDESGALAREAALWAEYAEPLSGLRQQLGAEFEAQARDEGWTPLAVYGVAGRRLVLVIPPGGSLPRLLEQGDGPPPRWNCVLDFAGEAAAAADDPEFILGDVVIDPSGGFLAYTVDTTGADRFTVRIRRLDGGLPGRCGSMAAAPSLAWDAAAGRVLYLAVRQHLRPAQLRAVHPESGHDELLADLSAADGGQHVQADEEGGQDEYVELFTSSDGAHVLAAKELHSRRSVWLLHGPGRLVPLLPARDGLRVHADVRGGRCAAIVCDGQAADVLLLTSDLDTFPVPDSSWSLVCRAEPGLQLEDLTLSDHHIEVLARQGGGQRLLRFGVPDGSRRDVVFADADADGADGDGDGDARDEETGPELAAIEFLGGLRPPGAGVDLVRASWHSPPQWYRLDGQGETAGSACPPEEPAAAAGRTERARVLHLEATSADGTRVPLTVLRPPGQTGPLFTVLYAYGAYGLAVETSYSIFRPSLFRRGVAFAVAHVRGGGEHGTAWHEAGRGPGKLSAVEDYLACVRRLTDDGLTPPGGVIARARSAGAAIVGAAINREPSFFVAGVLEVPFVDCLTTLLNPDDPLASLEWDEWGNPLQDADARAALAALSPVDNVAPASYPALMLTAGLADVRVQAREPLRFAAAVRAASTSGRPVLVRAQEFGHLGPSDAADDRRGEAEILAFVLRETKRM